MMSLFKRTPAKPPSNGMSPEDRKKAFWLLKKYTSIAAWSKCKSRFDRVVAEVERLARAGDDSSQHWLKDIYEEQVQYEKALNKLARGDRSCFLWGPDGSFCYTGVAIPYLQHILNPYEYSIDEELYARLIELTSVQTRVVADGQQARRQGSPAEWLPHWLLNEKEFGPFNFPDPLPDVPLHEPLIQVKTGQQVPHFGIWEPDIEGTCMNYLRAGREAPQVEKLGSRNNLDTTWTLLWIDDRYQDGAIPDEEALYYVEAVSKPTTKIAPASARDRCEAGQPCPREGWWSTPAQVDSRRYFKQGEIMPHFRSDYGDTIWYWEHTQAPLAGE